MFYSDRSLRPNPLKGLEILSLFTGVGRRISWSKVIPLLQAKDFHVVAVQNPLTSC